MAAARTRPERGSRRLGVAVALGSLVMAVGFHRYPVTSSLLCLVAASLTAQTLGTVAGMMVVLGSSLMLCLHVFPLDPFLVPEISAGAFLLVSSGLCLLQGRLPAARRSESRALALVSFSRELSEASSEDELWRVLDSHLQTEFGSHQVVREGEEQPGVHWPQWETLPDGLGRVGLASPPEERQLLEAFLLYTAQAVVRLRLARRLREADLARARERLYQALLDSISHDLRIPLVSITGVLSGLLDEDFSSAPETRHDLLENALSEAERLRRLVENLLQMTRLEAGALKVTKKPYDMAEVVTAVLDGLARQLSDREVDLDLPDGLPLVPQDPILIGQVLRNLLDNALKYSPSQSPLLVEVRHVEAAVEVAVKDQGQGVPADEEEKVFEKFFRGRDQAAHGSGLGLSICAGLIHAHGGSLRLSGRPDGGTEVAFSLPLTDHEEGKPCHRS